MYVVYKIPTTTNPTTITTANNPKKYAPTAICEKIIICKHISVKDFQIFAHCLVAQQGAQRARAIQRAQCDSLL